VAKSKILVTTAIDYTNDVIHIGHAYQKILADALVRHYRLKYGEDNVYFLTGTDEYGTTNEKAAKEAEVSPREHVDNISKKDQEQLDLLNISYDRFIRTTDKDHMKTAQKFYSKAFENGDIYKGLYDGLYCNGCESAKTLSELNEQGQCALHPTKKIQQLKEENYFFKWSKYSKFILKQLSDPNFVLPEGKRKEMISFVEQGLRDIPISRPKSKVSWGIDVPNDADQVIYVWFDALVSYFTGAKPVGFWDENTKIIHILGKDNTRWHAVLWPAMLKSAGERLPDVVYVHDFISLNGQKISKSLGNIIRPSDLVEKYGSDITRYYFLKHGPVAGDADFTEDHLKKVYNADLANGLGNTVARIAKLAENSGLSFEPVDFAEEKIINSSVFEPLKKYRADLVLANIWRKLASLDKHINDNEPWKIKEKAKLHETLLYEITELRKIAFMLVPFVPVTAKKIQGQLDRSKIEATEPLFPRI